MHSESTTPHAFRIPVAALALGLVTGGWALSVKSLYPANGATGQCLDTPLRMVLSGKAVQNWGGSVHIRNMATNAIVKTWTITSDPGDPNTTSVGASWPWTDSVGNTLRNIWPVVIDSVPEQLAEIRIPQHLLLPSTKYQVDVDAGVLKGSDGTAFSGVAAGSWSFTTGAKPSSKSTVVVAQDNSGDVCSIQAGIDLVPSSSATAVQVLVRPGYYREMLAAKNKNNLRLYGSGEGKTFVRYLNNNNLNTTGSSVRNLALLGGNGMQIRAMSITNTTAVTGGQAEALYLQGDTVSVADIFLHSFQDTWLNTGGRVYVQDSRIEGSVDFIWGYNPVFFKRCSLVVNRTGGVVVQPRNTSTHGYVFDSCQLSSSTSGFTGCHFARDAGASYASGEVMFLHTTIVNGTFLASSPWTINATTDSTQLRFCEYQSRDQNGTLISITDAQRKRLQCASDSATQHAKPSFVLSGWTPTLPTLASVVALAGGTTAIDPTAAPRASEARLIRDGNRLQLEIDAPGPAVVRQIRADGTSHALFRCAAPCREALDLRSPTTSWIEVLQPSGRTVLPVAPTF
jgi:pectin methylesterase-like acyl-CoA thioesterase